MSSYTSSDVSVVPYVEPTPLPSTIPEVQEIGTTSGPLKSAAFFIGAYCKPFNEDFMLCKAENRRPEHCLKEGRKVTRCTAEIIEKLRENCLEDFETHWKCLENNNQTFYMCRPQERAFNKCVFNKLGLRKDIPGAPKDQPQIHEKQKPIFGAIQK